jgi:anaerobic glycerol-3-phosphate dehydrogenase C subunit/anaerobic glycerol-3-phosphate dehydrogenase B subunit
VNSELHYDVLVIGAGTAGLAAATRLAQQGAQVCVLAKGIGSTHLAPGTIDVLGYGPELVRSPRAALEELAARRPEHPYALLGGARVEDALRWFADLAAGGPLAGYHYQGSLERNLMLPTALGTLRPSALVPATMAAGDAAGLDSVCIVGSSELRDFHAQLCAANLRRAGPAARALSIDLELERADAGPLSAARRFDDPAWRARFCARLLPLLGDEEHVGLPAVLGLRDPHGAWTDLQQRLGRRVFEIPTLPPSVSGMRMFELLRSALRAAGARLVLGAEVLGAEWQGGRVVALRTAAAGHPVRYRAPWIVLASGGFASGAIELDSRWSAHERVLGLALEGIPTPGQQRFGAEFLDEQPLAAAGVAVDSHLRARDAENVLVAGAALPGAAPWREGSGEGIALASALHAAELICAATDGRRLNGAGAQAAGVPLGVGEQTPRESLRDTLDHCVKCTICETACPVSNATPLFGGPKYTGPQAERYRVAGAPSIESSVDYCSGCGICTQVCPQGVRIAELNARARAALKQRTGIPLRDRIITRPTWLGRLGTPTAGLANATLGWRPARVAAERVLGVHRDAPVPRFAGRRFSSWAAAHASPPAPRRAVYFHGCGTEYYEPWEGEKVVAVLEHNGFTVEVPKQDCCGLPLQSSGLFDDARRAVLALARALAPHLRDPDTIIVGNATSCTLMLKREAREILGLEHDPDLALVAARTYDVCELLVALHHRGELRTDFRALAESVAYHAPCQQQGHWIGKPALELLELIPGLTVFEMNARCCGIAGTYGLKAEKYDIAMAVGSELFDQVAGCGAQTVACDSETCRWQITHGTGRPSVHPIDFLHRAYGL